MIYVLTLDVIRFSPIGFKRELDQTKQERHRFANRVVKSKNPDKYDWKSISFKSINPFDILPKDPDPSVDDDSEEASEADSEPVQPAKQPAKRKSELMSKKPAKIAKGNKGSFGSHSLDKGLEEPRDTKRSLGQNAIRMIELKSKYGLVVRKVGVLKSMLRKNQDEGNVLY